LSVVYVIHDSSVERRAVRLGAKTSAGQIVIAGLSVGNIVALGDLAKLHDGARIRIEKKSD
jgi:hypothetical protein